MILQYLKVMNVNEMLVGQILDAEWSMANLYAFACQNMKVNHHENHAVYQRIHVIPHPVVPIRSVQFSKMDFQSVHVWQDI